MRRTPIPTIDRTRVEYGQRRTKCSCRLCVMNCRYIPGYLISSDLERMLPGISMLGWPSILRWAEEHLLASPGALLLNLQTGQTRRVPTLVPARKTDGTCINLDKGKCMIHEVAPFGCAFFDHTTPAAALHSLLALEEIERQHSNKDSTYSRIWNHLHETGFRSPDPKEG